jgi:hypothetical protein
VNLCVVTSSYPANPNDVAAPYAADFCRAIVKRGHKVVVVAPERPGIEADPAGVPVFWVPSRQPGKALVSTNLISPLQLLRTLQLMGDWEGLLRRTVREQSIDVCLALWAVPGGYLAWRLRGATGVPYAVWTLGSDINTYARYPLMRSLIRRILRGARWRFADGIELAARTKIVGGLDCEFLPTSRAMTPSGEVLDVLMAAMARLKDIEGIHLYVRGDGSLEAAVASQIRSEGLEEKVTMIPRGPASHLAAYMKACDCLVIPSRKESIPVVFSEAIQMGIPMLVTDTGDMGTLAREHGLMDPVPPEDADALARAMRAFADDGAEFKQRFSAARPELLRMFDPEIIVDRFLSTVGGGSSTREAD